MVEHGQQNFRHAIGIGGQKCASSWLHAVVAAHPGVCAGTEKELDFFSYRHDRGHAWYRAQFAAPGLRWENSPSYLHDPRSPGRVRAFDPAARIVVTLRDPVERAYSHHLHEIARGHIPPMPFGPALADNPDYVEQGFYARHLAPWLAAFPAHVHVEFAEDIAADPVTARQRVLDFLGLDPAQRSAVAAERRNVSDRARLPALRLALRSGGDALRALGMEERLAAFKRQGPVRRLLDWNSIDLRRDVPPLTEAERATLGRVFRDDGQRLAEMLGRRTLPWHAARGPAAAA